MNRNDIKVKNTEVKSTEINNIQVNSDIPTLISFSLCPYVQRSAITLNVKKVEFDRIYIDLSNPPEWFTQLSPTGKVPALLFNNEILFESAVINEFVDEEFGLRLQEKSHWDRAQERAWISFVDELIIDQYKMLCATNKLDFEAEKQKVFSKLKTIAEKSGDLYFSGNTFGLLDAAIAPVFTRLKLSETVYAELKEASDENNKLINWMDNLLQLEAVKNSIVEDFNEQFLSYFEKLDSYLLGKQESTVAA